MEINFLLVIVLLVLLFCAISGYRKGLLGIVYGFVSWIIVFAFIVWSNPYIENYLIEKTGIYDRVLQSTQQYMLEHDNVLLENASENKVDENEDVMTSLGIQLPEPVKNSIVKIEDAAKDSVIDALVEDYAGFVIKGIAVIIALIVAKVVVGIIGSLIKMVGNLPIINGINGFFGIIAGGIQGLLYVWIFMYVLALMSTSQWGALLIQKTYESTFLTYLYDHNLVITIIQNF